MTHHTWIWEIKNITKKPLEQIYYHLDGDIPKEFSDLNLKIIDGNNEKVELLSLDSNKEHEKKFNVRLNKPIKRNQRSIIKLEYDWEEPYKSFEYWFAAKCKKFRYVLRVPKSLQIKNRVLQVVRELGIKKRAEPASKIVDYPDVTEVIWENDKKHIINRHDTFEFQW